MTVVNNIVNQNHKFGKLLITNIMYKHESDEVQQSVITINNILRNTIKDRSRLRVNILSTFIKILFYNKLSYQSSANTDQRRHTFFFHYDRI